MPEPADPSQEGNEAPSGLSRRRFIGRGSLGVAAAGVLGSVPALPSFLSSSAPEASGDAGAATADASAVEQTIVAHVHDINAGEISLYIKGQTISVRDPQLARTIARALP
ncbi:MAG: twin-arginine translocation signal domain-containing protein [Actinomycetota bacterium]|nr:twin-arginine translocation signal domain-containing protein [Actinomycetota bacterium]